MKQTINFTDFTDAFKNYNRQEQFSYNGKKALFEYFEEYEESTGEEIELDVIALCCEYVEYDSLEEFWQDYDEEDFPHKEAIEWHTQFIPIDNDSFIIAAF